MRHFFAAVVALAASAVSALAQSSPNLIRGQIPTAGQWNGYFAAKQDVLGFTPLNSAGGVMTGPLVTVRSSATSAGFSIPSGAAPTTPIDGDVWTTTTGLFVRINGVNVGPLTGGGGSSFAATSPIAVTFPAGVVTYAFDFSIANTFTAAQTVRFNAAALPAAQTGTGLRVGGANATPARIEVSAFGAQAFFTSIAAGGTAAVPTALTANTQIGGYNSYGYNGAAYVGPSGTYRCFAAETWTSLPKQGTYCEVGTTANGGTTLAATMRWEQSGGVTMPPGVTGGDKGAGTLNVTGPLYIAGTQAATTINATSCPLGGSCTVTTAATSVVVGTTTITSGVTNQLLYDNGGVLGEVTKGNNCAYVTSAAGVPSCTAPGNGIEIALGAIGLTPARRTGPTTSLVTLTSHSGGFAANASGTYTTPANVLWLEGWIVGGGGGGSGSGAAPGAGGTGGDSCWNTSGAACTTPVYNANGGTGGNWTTGAGGSGGAISGSTACNWSVAGGEGGSSQTSSASAGGAMGGASSLGGAGGKTFNAAGSAAAANSGSGGQGGGVGGAASTGPGGGAGATCYFIILNPSPSQTFTYVAGAAGTAGTAGASFAGGTGGGGRLFIIEHYGTWLLRRDLDPAANDNTPMFMDAVA
jgi:hypothetical protein